MDSDFEYVTYTDDGWPAANENGDVTWDGAGAVDEDGAWDGEDDWDGDADWASPADRTEALVSHGRTSAPSGKIKGRLAGSRVLTGPLPVLGGHGKPAIAGSLAGRSAEADPGARPAKPIRPADADGPLGGARATAGAPAQPRRPGHKLSRNLLITGVAALAVSIGLTVALRGPGPGWPSSVAGVKQEIKTACRNPDIASDPGQVNFACGKDSSQILWVFALLTSGDNPNYADQATGRKGLEPITPAQGGEVAWALNLHHPYNPANPIDSLTVAARAINNIIGGATVTSQSGSQQVQPGLESNPANCQRYTGSSALITRQGFPSLCAEPVTSPQGESALIADIYRQWMVGASSQDASNAALLFTNASNPSNAQVQAILRSHGLVGK
ncbi:MAG TPA: hypothetical protein VMG38_16305 [Trebonia sp.]|nr:hypothetical protein [Trebonia sp.]